MNGVNDAKDSSYVTQGRPHVRHVKDHGCFADFPWDFIVSCRKEWVERIGRGWTEFTDSVRNMEVE
ncbi:MAG: hypothetical protein IBX68_05575 [Dehalococcoidia bacterium]|nr:hypothetical protein [Dehalococcoidia bacterium]